jgi:hypothetical protein
MTRKSESSAVKTTKLLRAVILGKVKIANLTSCALALPVLRITLPSPKVSYYGIGNIGKWGTQICPGHTLVFGNGQVSAAKANMGRNPGER